MRLLKSDNEGGFSFTTFKQRDVPPYAILSHTWDSEEVTFQDFTNPTGKRKAGYEKIRFCGEQARRDGLHFFWVDTCCINKTNNFELTTAINNMFHWYQTATKCYVYLSDVSNLPEFAESRWFTRGWTLQELLAPKSVEFFSYEGVKLGDKKSLVPLIGRITGIPEKALQGLPLSSFSVTERISWQENRGTTRAEDKYYSLLGIFDVHLPLLYGEGGGKAVRRLIEQIKMTIDDSSRMQHLLHYHPLNEYGFRIMQLHPTSRGREITGRMEEFPLESQEYNALSYVGVMNQPSTESTSTMKLFLCDQTSSKPCKE
jgi:hypothetical protein